MPKPVSISLPEARLLALKSQGLLQSSFDSGKFGALKTIEHLGYIQIDTLSVVARAHHHSLWNRVNDYNEKFLNELLELDKSIFEYWSHAASYLPICDYRFTLPRKKLFRDGKSHWFEQDKRMMKYVLDKIKAEGALQSKDFEFKRTGPGNWYEWKPAKRALEQLFMEGKLMVAKRQGFQKVYDLTERVLPTSVNRKFPSEKEMAEHLIYKSIQSHGMVSENEIVYLRTHLKESVKKTINQLLKKDLFVEIKIETLEKPFITTKEQLDGLKKINFDEQIRILSPFDNLIIQRKRLLNLFDFDYMIECYLPEQKRKYGYFTLPVLYNDKFVARFDPKADRASKAFYIKSIHFEKGFKPDEAFNTLFATNLKRFLQFNGCNKLVIEKADSKWKKEIVRLVK